jgi:hypothetical protein
MNQGEYERRKRGLDDQLAAGIELLRAAHRTQLRALELVWMASPENPTPVPPGFERLAGAEPSPVLERVPATSSEKVPAASRRPLRPRLRAGVLIEAVETALDRLPEVFDSEDVLAVLEVTPERSSLYRVLDELRQEGTLEIERRGGGRYRTRYRRGAPPPPEAADD